MAIHIKLILSKANCRIRLFLFLILFFCLQIVSAQQQVDTRLLTTYEHFLNFQLDSCKQEMEKWINPSPLQYYLKILYTSTSLFIIDDNEQFKNQKFKENGLLEQLDDQNYSEAYTTFLKSEIKLQWAILKLKHGEEFTAFWNFRQAYNLAKENIEIYPDFLPSYKTIGLLHVFYSIFPDKYNWILTLFGLKGNVEEGLSELEKVWESSDFFSLESGLIITLLHGYLLNNPAKGCMVMQTIYDQHQQMLITYIYSLILMKARQSEKAFEIIKHAELSSGLPWNISQMYYNKAEILVQKGLLDDAIFNYQLFLDNHTGLNLIKDTYFKIGLCYLIKDNEEMANEYFEKSKLNGWAKNEADKYARNVLENEHLSNKIIYQLRFATDGGYYEEALKIQGEIDTIQLNNNDRCEYFYRCARLFQYTGKQSEAIQYYKKTISAQGKNNWYFAPNSALQLGLIFDSLNDEEKAKKYLHLIDEYKDFPYESSIRQKAKAALNQLN